MTIKDGTPIPPFQDVEIQCCDCGECFIFYAAEQEFFYDRHLQARKRCKKCTDIRHRRYPPTNFATALEKAQSLFPSSDHGQGVRH